MPHSRAERETAAGARVWADSSPGTEEGGQAVRRLDLGSVNWWDGMLIAQSHLLEQERYHDELLRWLARHGLPLYGILPSPTGDGPALEVRASLEGEGRLRVELLHCRALTLDGSAVHIDANGPAHEARPVVGFRDLSAQAPQTVPVHVRVAGDKLPLGGPDGTGNAPRRTARYELLLDDTQVVNDGASLKVAEIKVENFQAAPSPDYLPPCATIDAVEPLRRTADEIRRLAQVTLDEVVGFLAAARPAADMHPWNLAARGALEMMATGGSLAIESLVGWEAVAPPHFVGGLRALLRTFSTALAAFSPVKEHLDEQFLQTGGLPGQAGGLEFHAALGRYVTSPYVHEAMGRQLQEGQRLLGHAQACLRFIGEKLTSAVEAPSEAPRPKVTYRQQDYYLLETGQIQSSFTEESQVLYFRDLGKGALRSVLFVLRNNAAAGVDERDVRLKGGVNDDRPLYCPELQPDFRERPGRIYLLMEVERNKREKIDYITLRSSGVLNLQELLQRKETDIRLYYL